MPNILISGYQIKLTLLLGDHSGYGLSSHLSRIETETACKNELIDVEKISER